MAKKNSKKRAEELRKRLQSIKSEEKKERPKEEEERVEEELAEEEEKPTEIEEEEISVIPVEEEKVEEEKVEEEKVEKKSRLKSIFAKKERPEEEEERVEEELVEREEKPAIPEKIPEEIHEPLIVGEVPEIAEEKPMEIEREEISVIPVEEEKVEEEKVEEETKIEEAEIGIEEEAEFIKPEEAIEEEEKVEKKSRLKSIFAKKERLEEEVIEEFTDEPAVIIEPVREGCEELVRYPLIEGYTYVRIVFDKEAHETTYDVIEPVLSKEEEEVLSFVDGPHGFGNGVPIETLKEGEPRKYLLKQFYGVIVDYDLKLAPILEKKLFYYIERDFLGFGKINVLMLDPYLEDVSCDGPGIYLYIFHRDYESLRTNLIFETDDELDLFVMRLAQLSGRSISVTTPMLDATLPEGSRIQLTLRKEVTAKGSTFSIRRFRLEPFTPVDLITLGTGSPEMMAYFWLIFQYKRSAIISGGTAAGKTTTLNAITLFVPMEDKIVSIEDTRELNLPHPNWIPSVQRIGLIGEVVRGKVVGEIDMFDLLKAALRQRPEYIIVGEIRGEEAYVLFQGMATGHATYSTFHADSVTSMVHRFVHPPINIPHMMMASLDVVSIQKIVVINGKRARRITNITEVVGIDPQTNEILTNELFTWDPATDDHEMMGRSIILKEIAEMNSMNREEMTDEFKDRVEAIEWAVKNKVRNYVQFSELVYDYYKDKEAVMKRVRENGT